MKCGFYGRFSTDLQKDESIEDQKWACERLIENLGGELVPGCEYSDNGISGQTLLQRAGVMALLQAAESPNRPFDTIVVRQLSRLSRDIADSFTIFKRLKYVDVRVLSCDGFDSNSPHAEVQLLLDSYSSSAFIKSVKHNVRIALQRRFQNGLSTGGKTLGYTSRPIYGEGLGSRRGQAKPIGYEVIPHPEEAQIVHQVFELAKLGHGVRTLTRRINQQYPGYNLSQSGISRMLRNKQYIGLRTYNRLEVQINPLTGKISFKKRPPEQWYTISDPKVAIVDKSLFDDVQLILSGRKTGRVSGPPASKWLLSGLLYCGLCGHAFTIADHDRYTCRDFFSGCGCSNDIHIDRPALETIIIGSLRQHLEERVGRLIPAMTQVIKASRDEWEKRDARLRHLRKEKENLMSFIRLNGLTQLAVNELSVDLDRVCKQIQELEEMPEPIAMDTEVIYDSSALHDFIHHLPQALSVNLNAGRTLLRQILTRVTVHPGAHRPSRCPICKKERRLNGKHTRMHGLTRAELLLEYPTAGFSRDCRIELRFNPTGMMEKFLSADLSITDSGKSQIITLDPLVIDIM